jgi:HEAT repeat protein
MRRAAIRSDAIRQSYVRKGCGNGRERADAAWNTLVSLARAHPYVALGLLRDPSREVRAAGALVLGWNQERAAVAPLIEMLAQGDEDLRVCAAGALGEIRDRAAVPALVRSLTDPSGEVRANAAAALWAIGDVRASEALRVLAGSRLGSDSFGARWLAARALEALAPRVSAPR